MPTPPSAQIEIGLHRTQSEFYDVELRVTDPDTESEIAPFRGRAPISLDELRSALHWPEDYGERLTARLFDSPSVREFYSRNKALFDSRGLLLRVRIFVGDSAPELHSVRWELLRDPDTGRPVASSERVLVSRFLSSRDWRAVKLRPKAELRALIAVAAPTDAASNELAEIDHAGEVRRARDGLAGLATEHIEAHEPVTLDRLIDRLRAGVDILYLVCHGSLPDNKEPFLFLQNDTGQTAAIYARELAERIEELQNPPRLIVMASCESATKDDGTLAQFALAPRLADAGVPAVVAMQGQISAETVKRAMPVFFRELARDGQIDRAMAVARGAVRDRPDHWMPALFLRLKSGRIWYESGFGGEGQSDFKKWWAICSQIRKQNFVPIVGPELAEDEFGGTRKLAGELAATHAFPLAAHDRTDLAKVTQFISANQDRGYALEKVQNGFLKQIKERLPRDGNRGAETLPEFLDRAAEHCLAKPNHPYKSLAQLPAGIYVNAGYESLLSRSLRAAGRSPEAIYCSWRGVEVPSHPRPRNPTPTAGNPWVYHVFGMYGRPDTMVFTEDDFFDFLIASSRLDLLSPALVGRLMQSSLLFLGFRLDDWRFRVLFRLIVTRQGTGTMKALSHVGVQVDPNDQGFADADRAKDYIERYFQGDKESPEISIYWGTAADFLTELEHHLAEAEKDEPIDVAPRDEDDWL